MNFLYNSAKRLWMDEHHRLITTHGMKFLDSSSQAPEHQMTLQICKVHNMLYLESISEYIGAHLNKQKKKKKKQA